MRFRVHAADGCYYLVYTKAGSQTRCSIRRAVEEEEIFYMFRPDNTSDHMQQGLMTLHHIISLQQ